MEEAKNGASAPKYSFDGTDDNANKEYVVRKDSAQPDLEVQINEDHEQRAPPERAASNVRVAVFLAIYFVMNISLTLYNKTVLGSFAFPWILTAIHTGLAALGSYLMLLLGYFELTVLSSRQQLALFMFSLLFTLNIAMSNVSLGMVSIPFHQVMRATSPIITIFIYRIFFARRFAWAIYASIVPTILGVALATFGDYYFTTIGFTLTLAGVILASIKTVVTNRLMTGRLRLGVFELLLRMGPLAAIQSLLYSMLTGEFSKFMAFVHAGNLDTRSLLVVSGNGVLAFVLNLVSFQTNKLAGALSITICANLKQCFTIALGAFLWHVPMNTLNKAGILMAIAGAAWYSTLEFKAR